MVVPAPARPADPRTRRFVRTLLGEAADEA
jgi:hypothetical protein